jgi:hypothetical protein
MAPKRVITQTSAKHHYTVSVKSPNQSAQQQQQQQQQQQAQAQQDSGSGSGGGGGGDGGQSPYDSPTAPAGDTPWFDTDQPFDNSSDIDDSMSGPRRAPARMASIGAAPASPTQDVTTIVLFAAVAYFGWQWLKRGGR